MARPHWGKNIFLNLNKADHLYPDLDKWKRVYLLFNSDGTFDNEFTRTVGFENFHSESCHLSSPVPTLSAQAQLNYVEVSHSDQHTSVISSKVTESKVISAQPKRSKHHLPDPNDAKSHFIPRPILINSNQTWPDGLVMCTALQKIPLSQLRIFRVSTTNMKTVITMHGTADCLRVNEVWKTYLSHPLFIIPMYYSKIRLDNSWWVNTTNPSLDYCK